MVEQANGQTRARRETPYQQWQTGEGIPINRGAFVADLYSLEVTPWARMGQKGAFVNLADQEEDDGYVLEIAPGGQTEVLHHLFEATIYVLEGRGATALWQEGRPKQTVEWQKGSLFSPPLNCHYQHFNLDGGRPARMFAVTNAPMVMNIFRNSSFLFSDDYVFADRYNAEDQYFTDPGKSIGVRRWQTNFVADVRAFRLEEWKERGAGGTNMFFFIANNQMQAHISEFPPGTYKKGHRHGPGAHVTILDGQGYSLLWFEGQARQQVDWKDGTVLSPNEGQFHQHFNTGARPARYLALRLGALSPGGNIVGRGVDVSVREGGSQIEYEDEDREIYALYERECARNGATVTLPRPAYVGR